MADSASWGLRDGSSLPWLSHVKQSRSDRVMADERAIAVDESIATLRCHDFMACSGTGKRSVGTRGVKGGGGAVASSVRTGRCMIPKTPLWSKEVERVTVSSFYWRRCHGSQIVRLSMHVATQGRCGGTKVNFSSPFHLKKGRALKWASFGLGPVQPS